MPAGTVVCHCRGVTKETIVKMIAAGANCVKSIGYLTGAGTGDRCRELNPSGRSCQADIAELLRLYQGRCSGVCDGCGSCGGCE